MRWTPALLLTLWTAALACKEEVPGDAPDASGDPPDSAVYPPDPPDSGVPPLEEVCPRGAQAPVVADVNGDGVVDVADAIALQNHRMRGGPAPACASAADFDGDDYLEMDDADRISTFLVAGPQYPKDLRPGECDGSTPWPPGQCAPLGLELLGERRVSSAQFRAQVALRSPRLAVQGFSMSLAASGDCAIQRVSHEETVAAEIWDQPPGLRHLGFSTTTTVDGGAIAYLILSISEDISFARRDAAQPILSVDLSANVPASGCNRCTLSVVNGLVWRGQPIDTIIVAGGRSYVPTGPSMEVQVCAE